MHEIFTLEKYQLSWYLLDGLDSAPHILVKGKMNGLDPSDRFDDLFEVQKTPLMSSAAYHLAGKTLTMNGLEEGV